MQKIREIRLEQEEEQNMERAKEHEAQRMEAIARIVDYDPKQGGTYFSRLYFVKDHATFNYDEESPLGPMRYSNRIYEKDNYELCEGINILSLKIASSDVGFPLQVHGTVIARDSIDQRLVYLFNRDGDNCQVVNSEDSH